MTTVTLVQWTTISWNHGENMKTISMKLTWWEQREVLCFRHLRQRTLYANFVESGSNHPEDTKSGKENIFYMIGHVASNHLSIVSKFCLQFHSSHLTYFIWLYHLQLRILASWGSFKLNYFKNKFEGFDLIRNFRH